MSEDQEHEAKDDQETDSNNNSNENSILKSLQSIPQLSQLDQLVGYEKQSANLKSLSEINDENLYKNQLKYQKLIFANNNLWDISEFFGFENVVYLDLNHNSLQKLAPLSSLPNLEILILANNSIKSIGFMLVCLKRLQHLDLSFNQIDTSNDSFIRTLKFNSELVSLILKGNIEYKFDEIKYKCLEILPKVEYLDTEQIINNKKKEIIDLWKKMIEL